MSGVEEGVGCLGLSEEVRVTFLPSLSHSVDTVDVGADLMWGRC